MARGEVVDGTVASPVSAVAEEVAALLHCTAFRTRTSLDISTVEICGALKNVIAMGAGKEFALATVRII